MSPGLGSRFTDCILTHWDSYFTASEEYREEIKSIKRNTLQVPEIICELCLNENILTLSGFLRHLLLLIYICIRPKSESSETNEVIVCDIGANEIRSQIPDLVEAAISKMTEKGNKELQSRLKIKIPWPKS